MSAMNDVWRKPEPFFIEFGNGYLHGDLLSADADMPPELLFLHGAGRAGRWEFLLLRQVLYEQYGISSCSFDFMGYGWLIDNQPPVGLQELVTEASEIIDACFDLKPFSIIASDISVEIALNLTENFPVNFLLLLNPLTHAKPICNIPCVVIDIPVDPPQTLTHMNANPNILANVAAAIKSMRRTN